MPPTFTITFHDALPSTSDTAKTLAVGGAGHGTVVCAGEQTGGRGRLGRAWVSPPGNLYTSLVLRYEVAAARQSELGFVAAIAVAETVGHFLPHGPRARLKWPNDVLVAGAKAAGILLEADASPSGPWVVLGIGVNLAHAPEGLAYPTASLASLGASPPLPRVALDHLLAALGRWLAVWESGGFAPIRAAWLEHGPDAGAPLRVAVGNLRHEGSFAGLGPDGALLLATAHGTKRITSGEVG